MSYLRFRNLLPAFALLCLLAERSDAAGLYNYTDLGGIYPQALNNQGMVAGIGGVYSSYGPNAGQVTTLPYPNWVSGINDLGQVVGSTGYQPYLAVPTYHGGGPITYSSQSGLPGSPGLVDGINDLGQIVGQINDHAYLESGGKMVNLGALDNATSIAYGINSLGEVVGSVGNQPFFYSAGKLVVLGGGGVASAVNASGQVVGTSGNLNAFLYSGGKMTDLGTLGGNYSVASAINASGQVVGYSTTASGAYHAYLYSNGVMEDLNDLLPLGNGRYFWDALKINDAGQIIGLVEDPTTGLHGYLLTPSSLPAPTPMPPTPTPEPTTLALFGLAGLGLVARRALRRKVA